MSLNVLYKSTTHISIGDDIAFLGTKKLFDCVLPGHNAFLFSFSEKDTWKPELDIDIDLVVIAGTPVWSGVNMAKLERFIIEKDRPVFYCGVGMNYGENSNTSEALKRSIGFIGRDNVAYRRAIRDTDARAFSCPSIFSVGVQPITSDKIGIILQIDTELEVQEAFVRKFDKDEVVIICNEIVDYVWAEKKLGRGYEVVYSRWLPDMVKYYLRCKEIYSMRIHGAHLAYALGIPVVCTKASKDKSVVCKKIGLELVPMERVTEKDLRNDQNYKNDLHVKFMDYITLQMRKHFPGHVSENAWIVSPNPSNGKPVEWSDEKYERLVSVPR